MLHPLRVLFLSGSIPRHIGPHYQESLGHVAAFSKHCTRYGERTKWFRAAAVFRKTNLGYGSQGEIVVMREVVPAAATPLRMAAQHSPWRPRVTLRLVLPIVALLAISLVVKPCDAALRTSALLVSSRRRGCCRRADRARTMCTCPRRQPQGGSVGRGRRPRIPQNTHSRLQALD
jgi:hypothetical protein